MTAAELIGRSARMGMEMQQHPEEIERFIEWYLAEHGRPTRVLEIGVGFGGTAALWCEMVDGPDAQVVAVDMPLGHSGISLDAMEVRDTKLQGTYPYYFVINGNSQSSATRDGVARMLGDLVDILFIDGDHHYEAAKRDYELYSPLVKPGGVILLHDIITTPLYASLDLNVAKLWGELEGAKREWNIEHPHWGGLGALTVPVPVEVTS